MELIHDRASIPSRPDMIDHADNATGLHRRVNLSDQLVGILSLHLVFVRNPIGIMIAQMEQGEVVAVRRRLEFLERLLQHMDVWCAGQNARPFCLAFGIAGELGGEPGRHAPFRSDRTGHDFRVVATARFVIERGVTLLDAQECQRLDRLATFIEFDVALGTLRDGKPIRRCRLGKNRCRNQRCNQKGPFHRFSPCWSSHRGRKLRHQMTNDNRLCRKGHGLGRSPTTAKKEERRFAEPLPLCQIPGMRGGKQAKAYFSSTVAPAASS